MGAPFSRPVDSTSHAMVLVSTAAQGPVPRSVVLHDTRYDLPQPERLSVPSLQVTFARGSSPPRVEEVCEVMEAREQKQFDCSFDPATSADARRSLPSVALAGGPAAFRLPTAPETALPLSEGFTSAGIAGGLPGGLRGGPHAGTFFVNPSANHSAPMLLLEMRHDAPGKEVSAPPVQTHAQIQEAQEPACHNDPNDSDEIGSPLKGIYEVETVLNVRETVNGKREFLIKWKGWGPSWNNWEPEENVLDRRMLRKFNQKKRPVEAASSQNVDDFTMQSKRRCAKQAAVKARMAARKEDDDEDTESD